jgi:hypothetical protein
MSKNSENEIDILDINNRILGNFETRKQTLGKLKERLQDMNKSLEIENIRHGVKDTLQNNISDITDYIKDIEENISLNFYMLESVDLIEKYKEILNSPLKMSFVGKVSKNNREKNNIINQYLEVASKYIDLNINIEKKEKIICKNCSCKEFDIDDHTNIYICLNCSAQQLILKNVSSYRDINRINISTKYCYDRKIHFRDTIKQYQGKQLATIAPEVYEQLEKHFELHHLLEGDKDAPKEIRFKNITKEHINIFLKELEFTKHYENTNLIHYNITGKKPDNIGYLEDKLLNDFDCLTEAYDKKFKHIDRKNFINTQYILYQLLVKWRHPCKKEDFTILKTIDRKHFHDEVCKVLFQECGWTFISFW